jgi:hypothetical protein
MDPARCVHAWQGGGRREEGGGRGGEGEKGRLGGWGEAFGAAAMRSLVRLTFSLSGFSP